MKSVSEIGRLVGSRLMERKDAAPLPSSSTRSSRNRSNQTKSSKIATLAAMAAMFSLVACTRDYNFSYVYAPSASLSSGLINAYGIDYQTGTLRLLQDSPIPSGGRNPIAIAATPDHKAIFVVNRDDSSIVQLSIGTDGKLYPEDTYNATGSFPTGVAVSADGKFLYVSYTYQTGFTTASPGPGGITTFAIKSDDSLSAPLDLHIGRAPIAIATSASGNYVYVVAQDSAAVASGATQTSNLFAFQANASTGALTPLTGQTFNTGNVPSFGFPSGQTPAGIIGDSTASHLYITDSASNVVISYAVTNGIPTQIAGGTAATGDQPRGMAIDPVSGSRLYVANYTSGSISEYTFASNGAPVISTTAANTLAGTGTTCVTIEPTRGIYLYAVGSLSNTMTGEEIVPADGSLKPIINSPYVAATLPTCAVSVPRL